VANKLLLTDGVCEHSEPFLETDRSTVRLVSIRSLFVEVDEQGHHSRTDRVFMSFYENDIELIMCETG